MDIRIMDILDYTTSDGPGFRTSIYCAGCNHRCKGCHNPHTWDFKAGKLVSTVELYDHILKNDFSNVTFSGGDPIYQSDAFYELAEMIKTNTNKDIWCYTGFRFEEIKDNKLMKYIDVLVDGEFIESEKDPDLIFKGSRNQRLIDVQKSLQAGYAIEYDYNPTELNIE